jgi:aspartokinase
MYYIKKEKIIVEVADVMDARRKTVVTKDGSKRSGVKMVSYKNNLLLLIITGDKIKRAGALAEISHCIASFGANMAFIRNTRDNLYIVVEKNGHPVDEIAERICKIGYTVQSSDVSMVSIIGHLSWHTVERFNYLLHTHVKKTEFGAFPYRNCVRLEAIVHPSEVAKMVKVFHREFIK